MVYVPTVTQFLVGPEDARKSHCVFLGVDPIPVQQHLYDQFPTYRGLASDALNTDTFEATVILALIQTFAKKQQTDPFRVYLFVPATLDRWVVVQLERIVKSMFQRIKSRKAPEQARALGRAFHAILLGGRVLQLSAAPDRWVAFGFKESDPIPEWMRSALAPLPTCS